MKMIDHNHFICHCYYVFFCVFTHHFIRQDMILWKKLMTPSNYFCKHMFATLTALFLILSVINTAFTVCISKKIRRISVFLFWTFILESE